MGAHEIKSEGMAKLGSADPAIVAYIDLLERGIEQCKGRMCDSAACNCGGYHSHFGIRMLEEADKVKELTQLLRLAQKALDLRRQPKAELMAEREALEAIHEWNAGL